MKDASTWYGDCDSVAIKKKGNYDNLFPTHTAP